VHFNKYCHSHIHNNREDTGVCSSKQLKQTSPRAFCRKSTIFQLFCFPCNTNTACSRCNPQRVRGCVSPASISSLSQYLSLFQASIRIYRSLWRIGYWPEGMEVRVPFAVQMHSLLFSGYRVFKRILISAPNMLCARIKSPTCPLDTRTNGLRRCRCSYEPKISASTVNLNSRPYPSLYTN